MSIWRDFGKEREEFLRNFPELPDGIPDSDTFRRVFENLNPDPEELSECLVNCLDVELPDRCVICYLTSKTQKNDKQNTKNPAFRYQ